VRGRGNVKVKNKKIDQAILRVRVHKTKMDTSELAQEWSREGANYTVEHIESQVNLWEPRRKDPAPQLTGSQKEEGRYCKKKEIYRSKWQRGLGPGTDKKKYCSMDFIP